MRIRLGPVFLWIVLLCLPEISHAQSLADLPGDVLKDQPKIWTSPFRMQKSDAKWLLPFAAGTAALIASDHKVSGEVQESPVLFSPSHRISNLGSGVALTAASLGVYGMGKLSHKSRLAETGVLAGEAVIDASIVTGVLKVAFNRERPDKPMGSGSFWGGGNSFPSGHAAATWSFATVIARRYRDKPLVGISAYGVATAVSFARVGGLNHYPSDVLVGATIGTLVGRFVLRHRSQD
ncbi:MAG TPA: phosphatase PAP2 family protein [Terriglobia bacterium]|nr:phosphatase PAP2 family protein [Terriglobia bacterium]